MMVSSLRLVYTAIPVVIVIFEWSFCPRDFEFRCIYGLPHSAHKEHLQHEAYTNG